MFKERKTDGMKIFTFGTVLLIVLLAVLIIAKGFIDSTFVRQKIIDDYVKSITANQFGSLGDTRITTITISPLGSCKQCGRSLKYVSGACPSNFIGCLVNHGHLICDRCNK